MEGRTPIAEQKGSEVSSLRVYRPVSRGPRIHCLPAPPPYQLPRATAARHIRWHPACFRFVTRQSAELALLSSALASAKALVPRQVRRQAECPFLARLRSASGRGSLPRGLLLPAAPARLRLALFFLRELLVSACSALQVPR